MSASSLPPLFACDECQRIGLERMAGTHERETGHATYRLADDVAEGVREVWVREGRNAIDGRDGEPFNVATLRAFQRIVQRGRLAR